MDVSRSFSEVIAPPVQKKTAKDEIVVEEDAEFFKKYINMVSSVGSTSVNVSSKNDDSESSSTNKASEVTKFF